MKKFYVLAATLLVGSAASAQQLRLGAKVGTTYAKNTYSSDRQAQQNNYRLLGVSAGLMTRYAINPTVSLQTELLYVGKGRRLDQAGYLNSRNVKDRLHYLELPVLAHVSLRQFGLPVLGCGLLDLNNVTLEAGPQLSTFVARNYAGSGLTFDRYDAGSRRGYAALQLGFATGVGYELPQGWSLTLRHSRDITGVMRGNGFKGRRNSVFQLQMGYLLGGSN